MLRWAGRVAIVTGASAGIGEAVARSLVANGMKVVGTARRVGRLKAIAAELNETGCKGEMHAMQCDVSKEEDISRVVEWTRNNLGGSDVLVNNAGTAPQFLIAEAKSEVLRKLVDTNLLGYIFFTRDVVGDMRDRNVLDGHIFNINSIAGHRYVDFPGGLGVYSSTKYAIKCLTEGLRRELRDMNTKIRVTSISPGLVHTELLEATGLPKDAIDNFYSTNPYLKPDDIANALLYALSAPQHVQVHDIIIEPQGETF